MNTKTLDEISKKIDSILETETPESLLSWLEEKRKGATTPSPERGKEGKTEEEIFNFPIPSGFRIDVIVNAAISDKGRGKLIVHPDDLDITKNIFTQSKGTE